MNGNSQNPTSDRWLTGGVFLLVAFGMLMIYSASMVYAFRTRHDPFFFVSRQGLYAVVGLVGMLVARFIDYRRYRRYTHVFLLLSFVGVILTVTPLGVRINGASRWLRAGPIMIQPAEFLKLALVLWLAYSLAKKQETIKTFTGGFLPHLLMSGLLIAVSLLQPDFGTAVVIALLTFILLFVSGVKLGYILMSALVLTPIAYLILAMSPYRLQRLQAYLDPFKYRFGVGYQISESLISFGAGGLSGVGLGDGKQKLLYLPEAHNDFISAIVGEELGLIGVAILIAVMAFIVMRGWRIAARSRDAYGAYVAFGITALFALEALIHFAVTMGLIPTKGINLPLVSYGGSSLVVTLFSLGILLNISAGGGPTVEAAREEGRTSGRRLEEVPHGD